MRIKTLLFCMFIVYPFGSLPLILVEIYNRRYYSLFYLAVLIGLLGFLWIPTGDLYRVGEDFAILGRLNFSSALIYSRLDVLYNIIMFGINRLNLDFAFVRFSMSVLSYLLYFDVARKIIESNSSVLKSKSISLSVILVFFFLARFASTATGVRFTVASALFLHGLFHVIYYNNRLGWLNLLMSGFMHFSLWIAVLTIVVERSLSLRFNRLNTLVILLLLIYLSDTLVSSILNSLPVDENIKSHLDMYINGFFAQKEYELRGLMFRISRFIGSFIIYPAFLFVYWKNRGFTQFRLFLMFTFILALTHNMNSAWGRYAFISIFVFTVQFFIYYENRYRKILLYFICFAGLTYLNSFYVVRKELILGKQVKILYLSMPSIMTETYSEDWVNKNISKNGDLKSK